MRKKRIKNVVKQVFLTQEENARLLALMAEEEETNFSAYARKKLFNNELASWTVSFPEYEPMTEYLIRLVDQSMRLLSCQLKSELFRNRILWSWVSW